VPTAVKQRRPTALRGYGYQRQTESESILHWSKCCAVNRASVR